MPLKQCSRCRRTLALDQFGHDSSRPDGRRYWCKTCTNEAWREKHPPKGRQPLSETKKCARCGQFFPRTSEHFYPNNRSHDGLSVYCRRCTREYTRARDARTSVRTENMRRSRAGHLMRKYGITLDEFEALLVKQGGACATCGAPHDWGGRKLCVDHDHRTGEIRGVLCSRCNRLIGQVNDDPQLLEKMAAYLRESP